ncbi:MAG: FAD-binding oxidoreductase [Pleurocapsa minor GSE-CHR-MK-17-07R]|jgi:D-lactate dehydrogenase (cytochrome)|nr:FAD-binding oxidoreductase [Pleurocapsa minor GSE-CHR-MK 17-07R]
MFNALTPDILARLREIHGADNVSTARADIELHARDQSHHEAHDAEVVVFAQTAEGIAATLKLANDAHIPVTAWGVGTGLEGAAIPLHGGILLSLERMNRIVEVHADDFQVTVQPGIGHKDLNAQLARTGLFFPPDPGANATVGGMLANNAAGIRTVKYGATKDNVLAMQVALADGRLIRVGSRSVKQSSGYNLLQLIVGSEGTLGIITEATLKLVPVPAHMSAVVASFDTVEAAVETVVAVRGGGLDPAALELVDAAHCRMLRETEGVDLPDKPTLFMEFHAAGRDALEAGVAAVRDICTELGAVAFRATTDAAERKKLWHARHHSYEIMVRSHPGMHFFIMDVAVPISAYPELIGFVEDIKRETGVTAYMIGHAGDGNIHVEFPYADEAEFAHRMTLNRRIVHKALALGGTATGEHGVGLGKAEFMPAEHGDALDVMRTVKQALDPHGILNPGKLFPGE